MYKVCLALCKLIVVLNLILAGFFVLAGPPQMAIILGLAALTMYGAQRMFARLILLQTAASDTMDRDGTNDVEDWKETEDNG